MKAFVTDGDERPALAITRSLGRRGISVLVGEERSACLASSSRYCAGHVTYPSPYREPAAFQRFLAEFVERERVDVVVPVTDVTTSGVCEIQDTLGRHTAMAVPRLDAFDLVTDKASLLRAALRCGIPVPRTEVVDGIAGLQPIAARLEYPAVVKPVRSRILTRRGWLGTRVHHVSSAADLWRLYEQTDYLASHPSLIQQRIVGPGVGLFVMFDRGELLTAFAHRRIREKPPSGGVSVLCESVPVEPDLRDDAVRLLGPAGWHGIAMLEYKRENGTGNRFLLEVNGRFWGSLQLSVDAGVDFPFLSFQLACGRRPQASPRYRLGVRNRWLIGDVDHLLLRVFSRDRDLRLPDDAPSRLRTVLDFVRCTRPGMRDQVASGDDPGPFLYELRQYVRSLSASVVHRARGRATRAHLRSVSGGSSRQAGSWC
jgi:predicted ATP-grasp superfamily ATP-dependent carboligase